MAKYSTHVQTTNDYAKFRTLDGNRTLNELHLKRLVSSMRVNYLLSPIVVNERMEVIDGQHRFAAAKELGLPVNFIIVIGYGLREVQILNANAKNWTANDYLSGYCDLGYEDYLTYRTFREKYGFGHNECMAMLSGTTTTGKVVETFYDGTFKVKSYKNACATADLLVQVAPYYAGYTRRVFVIAMIGLLKNDRFVFAELLSKLAIQPTALVDCTNVSQYVELIERIYNYKRQGKVNLRY